jgi:hypothetical protein
MAMEIGALMVSQLCEEIARPLMGLRMIGVKPHRDLVVRARSPDAAGEEQVGQVHVRHWIARIVRNRIGVNGARRGPMPGRSRTRSSS